LICQPKPTFVRVELTKIIVLGLKIRNNGLKLFLRNASMRINVSALTVTSGGSGNSGIGGISAQLSYYMAIFEHRSRTELCTQPQKKSFSPFRLRGQQNRNGDIG
jgi:hypothetical protein